MYKVNVLRGETVEATITAFHGFWNDLLREHSRCMKETAELSPIVEDAIQLEEAKKSAEESKADEVKDETESQSSKREVCLSGLQTL